MTSPGVPTNASDGNATYAAPFPRRAPVDPAALLEDAVATARALRSIPWSARRFATRDVHAKREFGLEPAVLAAVREAGLPHVRDGDGYLFDPLDLTNLGLHVRTRTPQRGAMRFWGAVLDRHPGEDCAYEVKFQVTCPIPGHDGPCRYRLNQPDDIECEYAVAGGRDPVTIHTAHVHLRNDWPDAPEPLHELIDEIAHIRFMRLQRAVRWDTDFMLANGIGDCAGIARLLVDRGRARGLPIRFRFGLAVAPPYSVQHYWIEYHTDDRWVPYDPSFLGALLTWGVLDPARWHPYRSAGGMMVGISSHHGRTVSHGGLRVRINLPTQRRNEAAPGEPSAVQL